MIPKKKKRRRLTARKQKQKQKNKNHPGQQIPQGNFGLIYTPQHKSPGCL